MWDGKDVIIVKGSKTRLEVGSDLFDNALSVEIVLPPAENTFSCYQLICRKWSKELILLALGYTTTMLAYEFSKLDMRAIHCSKKSLSESVALL